MKRAPLTSIVPTVFAALVVTFAAPAAAQSGAPADRPDRVVPTTQAAAPAPARFDVEASTQAYLSQIPPDARTRSDAYFEGGYWLTLWDFLYGAAVLLALLLTGLSVRMRALAERVTRFRPLQTMLYWVQYLVITSVLGFPLSYYEGFVREHQYGLATQSFGLWLGDQMKALLLGAVFGAIVVSLLVGVVRRFERTWWVWGATVTMVFAILGILISPVYIVPLFNEVKPLQDPTVTGPILSMARANGIPAHDVFELEESKHSTRVSANVSGFGTTMRISLNDNLLKRASLDEIEAVMAHEMGHYVLNHVYKSLMFFFIVIVAVFAYLQWSVKAALARWGGRLGIHGIGDTAVLPLVMLLMSVFFFVLTPVMNTMVRVQEVEADMFGLNASGQPDGMAKAAVQLSEYRKMSPGAIEEWIFYDHPSGRQRIRAAMQWKSEHLPSPEAR
jgi:STE24 endopeptidase